MEGLVLAGIAAALIFVVVAVIGALRSARRHGSPPERPMPPGLRAQFQPTPKTTEARVPGPPPSRAPRVNQPVDRRPAAGVPDMPTMGSGIPWSKDPAEFDRAAQAARTPGIWPGTPEAERAERLAKIMEEVWLTGTPIVPTEHGSRIDWQAYGRAVVARGGLR